MEQKKKYDDCKKTEDYLYKIGMFAAMNHVTVKALRFYETQGLLIPAYVDEENGYRYYTMGQMATVHQITALKQAGFTLEDIAKIKAGSDEKAFLSNKKAELLYKIAELTKQVATIDGYLSKDKIKLEAPVLVTKIPKSLVAAMRVRIKSYDSLFELMPRMGELMEEVGCECSLPEYCFTSYPEAGYKEEDILVEICEAVTEAKPEKDGLFFKDFPEIEAACIYHKGPYTSLPDSYEKVLRFVEENGYVIDGELREKYIDGAWNKENESEWLTEIQVPIKKI